MPYLLRGGGYSGGAHAGTDVGSLSSSRTRLVQRSVRSLSDVHTTFSDTGETGDEVCVVITPEPSCCCVLLQQIPSGYNVFLQRFGRDSGHFTKPGGRWCQPAWNHVSHIVSRQVITFNAKPKKCPTRDHVFVDVNLSINLRVASDFDHVKTFVFELGAERLDAYLFFQVEESIRTLVYGVTHDRVNDLRSEFASEMLGTLVSKLAPLGLEVMNVKVTDVQLPMELQRRLELTTSFKTRLAEEQKNHEHSLQQLVNAHEQQLADILQQAKISQQQISAAKDRYEIHMDEKSAVAKSDRTVQTENSLGDREVKETKARGEIEVAAYEGRTKKDLLLSSTQIDSERRLREVELLSKTSITRAAATKSASVALAQAREAEAHAQGQAARELEQKTLFEHRLRLAELDALLAGSGRKLVDGDAGKSILDAFVAVRNDINQPPPQNQMAR